LDVLPENYTTYDILPFSPGSGHIELCAICALVFARFSRLVVYYR